MNPPFSLLPAVSKRIGSHGGHAVVVTPSWSPANPALRRLCVRSFQLPRDWPLFRARGASLLPPPKWTTSVYYICHMHITPSHPPAPPVAPNTKASRGPKWVPPFPEQRMPYAWSDELLPTAPTTPPSAALRVRLGHRTLAMALQALWRAPAHSRAFPAGSTIGPGNVPPASPSQDLCPQPHP